MFVFSISLIRLNNFYFSHSLSVFCYHKLESAPFGDILLLIVIAPVFIALFPLFMDVRSLDLFNISCEFSDLSHNRFMEASGLDLFCGEPFWVSRLLIWMHQLILLNFRIGTCSTVHPFRFCRNACSTRSSYGSRSCSSPSLLH